MMESKKKQKGTTILELMVVVFILVVGISGAVGLIHRTIAAASTTAHKLKAAYLAQEGIEIVRNIRDTNWVHGRGWLVNLSDHACWEAAFDHNSDTVMDDCSTRELRLLIRSNSDGFYRYNQAGVESVFKRKITTSIGSNIPFGTEYLQVKSTVYWSERGEDYSIIVVENLYEWR